MTKPWKDFRQEITRLYIHDGMTLAQVRAIMKEHHNFDASIRSYRQHFDHWGVGKYNCKKRQWGGAVKNYSCRLRQERPHPTLLSPPRTPLLAPPVMAHRSVEGVSPLLSMSTNSFGSTSHRSIKVEAQTPESHYSTPSSLTQYSQQEMFFERLRRENIQRGHREIAPVEKETAWIRREQVPVSKHPGGFDALGEATRYRLSSIDLRMYQPLHFEENYHDDDGHQEDVWGSPSGNYHHMLACGPTVSVQI